MGLWWYFTLLGECSRMTTLGSQACTKLQACFWVSLLAKTGTSCLKCPSSPLAGKTFLPRKQWVSLPAGCGVRWQEIKFKHWYFPLKLHNYPHWHCFSLSGHLSIWTSEDSTARLGLSIFSLRNRQALGFSFFPGANPFLYRFSSASPTQRHRSSGGAEPEGALTWTCSTFQWGQPTQRYALPLSSF